MGFLRADDDPISPDGPEHFPVVYAKTLAMLATEPELELASLAAVAAPNLVLQRDQGEHAAGSLSKGSRVVVVGRLQQRSWTAEDGSARSMVEVVADELEPACAGRPPRR